MKQSENVSRAYFLRKLITKNIFSVNGLNFQNRIAEFRMIVGFETPLLALNIIPIFFKNNVMKKRKILKNAQ